MQDTQGRELTYTHDERGHVYSVAGCELVLATQDDARAMELLGMHDAPPVVHVPQSVTRRQAKQALRLAGLLGSVQVAIDAIADATQRDLAQIEWDDSLEFQRDRPVLVALATAMGLSPEQLDQLFITASQL